MSITPYISNKGFIGIAKETTQGTPVAATDYFPFETEGFETDPGVVPVPTIKGLRAENNVFYLGEIKSVGKISMPFYPAMGVRLLAAAIGADSVTGAGPYVHTMTPNETSIPSITVEKALAALTSLQYTGCLVDKATFHLATNAAVKVDYDLVNITDAQISNSTPTYANETPFSLTNIAFTVFDISTPNVTAMDFTIDNGVKQVFTFGQRTPVLNYSGSRKVTGSITVVLQNMTAYSDAIAGTNGDLNVTMTQGTNVAVFDFLKVVWGKPTQPLKLGELIYQTLPFTAYFLGGASYDLRATVTNGTTAVYF